MRLSLILATLLLLPATAAAARDVLPDWETRTPTTAALGLERQRLVVDLMRDGLAPVVAAERAADEGEVIDNPEVDLIAGGMGGRGLSTEESQELARRDDRSGFLGKVLATDTGLYGRSGVGPWQLFDSDFDESGCRGPVVAGTADAVAVVCRGLDRKRPRDEHVVLLRGRRVERYPDPVRENSAISISADGHRVALVSAEGAGTLRLLDFDARLDTRITGGWASVRRPRLSGKGTAVAFAAVIDGEPAAIVVEDEAETATVAWRGGRRVGVEAIADDGARLLVRADPTGNLGLMLVDTTRGLSLDLAARKGDVAAAVLHRSADSAVFVTRVGGVCAVFWVDLTTRRRTDLTGTAEACFTAVDLDDQRRFLLYERTDSKSRSVLLHDRRTRRDWTTLPRGCSEATLSGDGYYVAARCTQDPRGRGVYLFAVPQENPAP
jgi:hypothetical protein